jgi:hypothetical protein
MSDTTNTHYKNALRSDFQKMQMQLSTEIKETETGIIKRFFDFLFPWF